MPNSSFAPSYARLLAPGPLWRRVEELEEMLRSCNACPCRCGVDRTREFGRCVTRDRPVVASWGPHFGEEPPISGVRASGTIFLANCNLRCVFCQNADISQRPKDFLGREMSHEELAAVMLRLQAGGCHNINWVSPTHQAPQLARALAIAAENGLRLPIVYNTNAYDSLEVLRQLEDVVDVWMPDLKYADGAAARELSRVPDYPGVARNAIEEMYRQVGAAWQCDNDGVLLRGLLIRILVLPGDLAGAAESLRWIAEELSPEVTVSLMAQYRPSHHATRTARFPLLARRITAAEYGSALAALSAFNASENTLIQPMAGLS